jgi:hypothetical protein
MTVFSAAGALVIEKVAVQLASAPHIAENPEKAKYGKINA